MDKVRAGVTGEYVMVVSKSPEGNSAIVLLTPEAAKELANDLYIAASEIRLDLTARVRYDGKVRGITKAILSREEAIEAGVEWNGKVWDDV